MNPTYEELERQLEESRREFRAADATIHNLELKLTDMTVQLANAESKCMELATENSNKSCCLGFFASVIKSGEEWTSVCEHEYSEAFKTPVTDAFLSEVRASARNDFIGRIEWIIRNECNPDKTEAIINELQNFSDELKQEEAQ